MVSSAAAHYATQKEIAGRAKAAGLRRWHGSRVLAVAALADLQEEAATQSLLAVDAMLEEQDIATSAVGTVRPVMFSGVASNGESLMSLLGKSDSSFAMARMFATQVADAGRVASGVSIVSRPTVQGYVRYLTSPSCARCAILAGRFYRWSTGFQRHPRCDCTMLPTNRAPSAELITNPHDLFERGGIRGLSKADTAAINDGADLSRVVNIRAKSSGLQTAGGRVLSRGGRPTPEGIYRVASDRDEAISLLRRFRYIT